METSKYLVFFGMEEVVRRFGPERLIFGSEAPFLTPGSPVTALSLSPLPRKDKEKIARENLVRLIDAFSRLRKQGFEHLKLLIIGDEISKHQSLRREVHRLKLHKYVRFFGFVPFETLAALYRLAGLFVFPSLYEGFGLPPLEAMACGTPVVTSNVSSLPEVVGDGALLIDPYDPDSIADGMRQVLTDEGLRQALRARGFAQVRRYSWDDSVRRVRDVYREVLEADGN